MITRGNFRKGYFSSNRTGSDDIYEYTAAFTYVEGQVLAKGSDAPIPGAQVILKDELERTIGTTTTDANGSYRVEIGKNVTFSIVAEKPHFLLDEIVKDHTMEIVGNKKLAPVYLLQKILTVQAIDEQTKDTLELVTQTIKTLSTKKVLIPIEGFPNEYTIQPNQYEIVSAHEGYFTLRDTVTISEGFYGRKDYAAELKKIVIGESIRLEHIYYDVNSAHLRHESEIELDAVVVFMLDNPHIKIELSSHTDARGSAAYNHGLSQKRAESATNYLLAHGIKPNRIVPKGYGEERLVNECRDGVKCSSEKHQENRRTEIKILENE